MKIALYPPQKLQYTCSLPASKSISNRALIINALRNDSGANVSSLLQNLSDCDDTKVMCKALEKPSAIIDIMAAGTAMRFLTAYYSVTPGIRTLTGTERMRNRPIGILVEALRKLGAQIDYTEKEGFPPLKINGTCQNGGTLNLPGSISSQYISALLMIGPKLNGGLTLNLEGEIISRPYINMTLHIMQQFGANVQWKDNRTIRVEQGKYQQTNYFIESDWSAASYWYEMVALTDDSHCEIILPGLFENSLQGDASVESIFEKLGVQSEHFTNQDKLPCVRLKKGGNLTTHLEYDLKHQPDLAQTLVVTCALKGITFRFTGLQSLKIKETDRITALRNELRKLGYIIEEEQDSILSWNGERCENETTPLIETYDDHRMALSMAPASFKYNNICIQEPQVVSKSYPQFWEHLNEASFTIHQS